jgi:hypothetical protein
MMMLHKSVRSANQPVIRRMRNREVLVRQSGIIEKQNGGDARPYRNRVREQESKGISQAGTHGRTSRRCCSGGRGRSRSSTRGLRGRGWRRRCSSGSRCGGRRIRCQRNQRQGTRRGSLTAVSKVSKHQLPSVWFLVTEGHKDKTHQNLPTPLEENSEEKNNLCLGLQKTNAKDGRRGDEEKKNCTKITKDATTAHRYITNCDWFILVRA